MVCGFWVWVRVMWRSEGSVGMEVGLRQGKGQAVLRNRLP